MRLSSHGGKDNVVRRVPNALLMPCRCHVDRAGKTGGTRVEARSSARHVPWMSEFVAGCRLTADFVQIIACRAAAGVFRHSIIVLQDQFVAALRAPTRCPAQDASTD